MEEREHLSSLYVYVHNIRKHKYIIYFDGKVDQEDNNISLGRWNEVVH